jgi:hypothetical protein
MSAIAANHLANVPVILILLLRARYGRHCDVQTAALVRKHRKKGAKPVQKGAVFARQRAYVQP